MCILTYVNMLTYGINSYYVLKYVIIRNLLRKVW